MGALFWIMSKASGKQSAQSLDSPEDEVGDLFFAWMDPCGNIWKPAQHSGRSCQDQSCGCGITLG